MTTALSTRLIREAAEAVAGVHEPLDRLAQHVGYLHGVVRKLCEQQASPEGVAALIGELPETHDTLRAVLAALIERANAMDYIDGIADVAEKLEAAGVALAKVYADEEREAA